MSRRALFLIAVVGFATPINAQQRTDAEEATVVGNLQRAQAAQFPLSEIKTMSTDETGVKIRVSTDASGTCWASRRGKRVAAEQARVLGPIWHGNVVSVLAARDVPETCLNQVVATLKSSGYRKLIPVTARD